MKLAYVHICGFRGYRKAVRIDFSDTFTIVDGRNGAGKSTIFDAVEFALTGTISKYLDAKSGRESVDDYIWWAGDDEALSDRFVEVGFRDKEEVISVRRTPLDAQTAAPDALLGRLVDAEFAPRQAMAQLCSSTIIRDEHIARLSLDLKEGDRFALLRDAIGAVDAEDWIRRAQAISSTAGMRVKQATAELDEAKLVLANATRQVDAARAALPVASLVGQAVERLQGVLGSGASAEQLPDIGRRRLADIAMQLDMMTPLAQQFEAISAMRSGLGERHVKVEEAEVKVSQARAALDEAIAAASAAPAASALGDQARQLVALADLGRKLGLRDGHCPLCESQIEHDVFDHGLDAALAVAKHLDAQAVNQAEKERARDEAAAALNDAELALDGAKNERDKAKEAVASYDARLEEHGLGGAALADIERRLSALGHEREAVSADLRLVDTVSLDRSIARATSDQEASKERLARAEERLGRARLGETRAKAIYDAARRAAAETLDQRLDRVLPLMSELYRRLRPHPVWEDIEYSVRGDVQRFLKLQVGGDINPQFVFSSGQRRATGLAFLLSVNLSLTWSRWRSILLDDPVQHVDDFRTVHLAEVLAHLCQSGRQIICAVEDSALADLMCRRLPSLQGAPGRRVTLGSDRDGAIAVDHQQEIAPLIQRSLVLLEQSRSA
ncbi:MAG: AAA family ATPase [Hyphomonas sp.]|jgi:energy-coupling factor transporter ATP-binding protein EcfA2|nr:AAA family ATPase [Hyphomonas sp.]